MRDRPLGADYSSQIKRTSIPSATHCLKTDACPVQSRFNVAHAVAQALPIDCAVARRTHAPPGNHTDTCSSAYADRSEGLSWADVLVCLLIPIPPRGDSSEVNLGNC